MSSELASVQYLFGIEILLSEFFVHETAVVDSGAKIGKGCRIWHWTHICAGARIGDNVSLGQNVFVGGKAYIGDNCKIQNNVSVYDNVRLEDGVFCGPGVVFTNVYNPRSAIKRKSDYLDTHVGYGVTLGANCTVICGISIGSFAFIGAGALVNKNVRPYALMVGVPARQIGWMSEFGEQLKLPINGNGRTKCANTGDLYVLENNCLSKVS